MIIAIMEMIAQIHQIALSLHYNAGMIDKLVNTSLIAIWRKNGFYSEYQ